MIFNHQAPSQTPEEIHIPGINIPVCVRRRANARRLSLRVSQVRRQAILTLPRKTSSREGEAFVQSHFDWLCQQIENLPPSKYFEDGAIIPLRGVNHRLSFDAPKPKQGIIWSDSSITDKGLPVLHITGAKEHGARRLKDWLISEARSDLSRRVKWHGANLGLKPKKITVRDQRTRWGSCSSSGTLSFSWRLILAPSPVLDYVAAHEVAHLREMNHGPRFWELVAMTMHDYQIHKNWLRENGAELHCYDCLSEPAKSSV